MEEDPATEPDMYSFNCGFLAGSGNILRIGILSPYRLAFQHPPKAGLFRPSQLLHWFSDYPSDRYADKSKPGGCGYPVGTGYCVNDQYLPEFPEGVPAGLVEKEGSLK